MIGQFNAVVQEPLPDLVGGGYILPLQVPRTNRSDLFQLMDKVNALDKKTVSITVKTIKKKRTLNANAFMWQICTDIAHAINDVTITKDDIYKQNIRLTNAYIDRIYTSKADFEKGKRAWQAKGTGWVIDVVDDHEGGGILAREYYGSSAYNRAEMAFLIDLLKEDARQYDLDYTPERIKSLLDEWEVRNG